MPGHVPARIVTERAARLRSIAKCKKAAFMGRFVDKELTILVQGYNDKSGDCRGLSRNYISASFSGKKLFVNEEVSITINSCNVDVCLGSTKAPI